ncbi:MAG: hypothetical protein INQ03_13405 [Candidatus Heimdallarchaeota archaeon]|nr:hypothetical protein [Candidatus Heimdallarchaeota archaeon]
MQNTDNNSIYQNDLSDSFGLEYQNIGISANELSIPNITLSNVIIDGVVTEDEYGASYHDTNLDMMVYWEHNGTYFKAALVIEATGWVSIGFGQVMAGSSMIMGGYDSGAYCYDLIGTGGVAHSDDTNQGGTYDISDCAATEDTSTTLEFIIPMDSGDDQDTVIEVGTADIFFAYAASSDGKTSMHTGFSDYVEFQILADDGGEGQLDLGEFEESIPFTNISRVEIDGIIEDDEYNESFYEPQSKITVNWEYDEENMLIGLESSTTGWLAFGIGDAMLDSVMIMGGIRDGTAYCHQMIGLADWVHHEDDTSDIIACEANEEDGITTLEFEYPLNTSSSGGQDLIMSSVYGMFLGSHSSSDTITSIHDSRSDVFQVLMRPPAKKVTSSMELASLSTQSEDISFSLEIKLTRDDIALSSILVDFFMEIAFGEMILESKSTDSNGEASISYTNEYLSGNHTFGARSKQILFVEDGQLKILESSTISFVIDFGEMHDEESTELMTPARIGIFVAFWGAGTLIWGSYAYSVYQVYQISKNGNGSEDEKPAKEEN